jgi:predicted RNase H-like HicB family nuclease/DNA-binding CsgD family transcriptional regulator
MSHGPHYRAIYSRDPDDDAWLVHIDGIDQCHSYGRTLHQASNRIEEALALWLDSAPDQFELDHCWPELVKSLASAVEQARHTASGANRAAAEATASAALQLTGMGLSRRDTAEILGLSHQRIQQLLNAADTSGRGSARQ